LIVIAPYLSIIIIVEMINLWTVDNIWK